MAYLTLAWLLVTAARVPAYNCKLKTVPLQPDE